MKRFYWLLIILLGVFVTCCEKENGGEGTEGVAFSLMDGSINVNNAPNIKVKSLDIYPEGISTENIPAATTLRRYDTGNNDDEVRGNDYRFKLVAEVETFNVDNENVQATHVKITDDAKYAFVSYNTKGDSHKGGVVVFKIDVQEKPLVVTTTAIAEMLMPKSEVSAIEYNPATPDLLYVTGATEDPAFGYKDDYNYAFYMVLKLDGNKKFKEEEPHVAMLSSFQGTSIRATSSYLYITTGDGKNGTDGGLYVIKNSDYSVASFAPMDYARSVDVDANNVYLMRAQPAKISKYDLTGNLVQENFYDGTGESMQENAKSELLTWNNYVFAALNESGLRMLKTSDGTIQDRLSAPGSDPENDVTNSVALNSDLKKSSSGGSVSSNLLLLANGEQGIFWYDVDPKTHKILLCNNNRISFGANVSANFIASRGNIVFVASGLGGLKILSIDFDQGNPEPPEFLGCDDVGEYFNWGEKSFLPDSKNVFGSSASEEAKKLFQGPDAASSVPNEIAVTGKTNVYITYISCTASFRNSIGYFVVPASHKTMSNKDYFNTITDFSTSLSANTFKLNEKYVILKNLKNSELVPGQSWQIKNYLSADGSFDADDRVVIFIIPNGWIAQNASVQYSASGYNSIIFMDKTLNEGKNFSDANYHGHTDFKGIQYNTFYSEGCNSIVCFFEDKFDGSGDYDFNDMIFGITDNPDGSKVTNLAYPRYALNEDGVLIDTK